MRILHNLAYGFAAIALMLGISGGVSIIDAGKTPHDYATATENTLSKGDIVEGDLYYTYGAYMESYTTNYGIKTGSSDYYYIIPIGETSFMGFKVNSASPKGRELAQMEEETYAYLMEETEDLPNTVSFRGKVRAMSNDELRYIKEALSSIGYTDRELLQIVYPYTIEYSTASNNGYTMAFTGIALFIGAVILWFTTRQPKDPVVIPTVADVINDPR